MNKQILINYIQKITKEDIQKYISKENIQHTKEEIDYTIDVLKKSLMFLRRVKRWVTN